jgi:hypothetical protein
MKKTLSLLFLTVSLITSCSKNSEPIPSTITVPVLTTNPITNITNSSAVGGGTIINNGGSAIIAEGVVWTSIVVTPTIDGYNNGSGNLLFFPKTIDGTAGSFTSNITGLSKSTKYFVCAYATNSTGTGYGDVVQFTTP